MFNPDDYNDNIAYCHYVFEKNIELDLGLDSRQEIQFVANNYLDEVIARRGIGSDEVYENDKILMEVIDKLSKKFKKFKIAPSKLNEEDRSVDPVKDKLANKLEKEFNRKGGHAYSESYDDEDELVTNVRL